MADLNVTFSQTHLGMPRIVDVIGQLGLDQSRVPELSLIQRTPCAASCESYLSIDLHRPLILMAASIEFGMTQVFHS